MKVVFLSDWLKNPYKDLLASGMRAHDATVTEYEWATFFLLLVFRAGKPSVLHLHTLHPFLRGRSSASRFIKLCIFASQICVLRLLGIKTAWTVHEWTDKIGTGSDEIPAYSCALIGKCLSAFIVHCQSTGTQIEAAFRVGGKRKVHVVPHGNYIGCYPNEMSRSQAQEEIGLTKSNVTFLLFGDLYRYKGVLESIDAFKAIDPQASISLIIAGKPRQDSLEREILEKIRGHDNIIFAPERVADNAVQTYMKAADCVLVPYTVFTTSGVAILAMSFGRVCIAPDVGFFNDMLNAAGAFLYDSSAEDGKGINSLANAMREAIEAQAQLSKMGDYNLSLAKAWNWKSIGKLTLAAYQSPACKTQSVTITAGNLS